MFLEPCINKECCLSVFGVRLKKKYAVKKQKVLMTVASRKKEHVLALLVAISKARQYYFVDKTKPKSTHVRHEKRLENTRKAGRMNVVVPLLSLCCESAIVQLTTSNIHSLLI